jgi:type II restriction/modification system DNA methylase subunit YeeA
LTAYQFKRECIENSLYGVDIDPGAVEIAKLRLWLSLVVDEDDPLNIKPLPNLDYKIMAGNSLLGLPDGILLDSEVKTKLEEKKKEYFYLT